MNIVFKNPTKIYIILSVLLLVGVFILHSFSPFSINEKKFEKIEGIDKNSHFGLTVSYSLLIIGLSIYWFIILLYGLANFFVLLYCFFYKKPFLSSNGLQLRLNLHNNQVSLAIFSIIYIYSVLYLLSLIIIPSVKDSGFVSIVMNLIFQLFVLLVIIKTVSFSLLGTKFSKQDLLTIFKVYSLTLVFIASASMLMIKIQKRFNIFFPPQEAVYMVLSLKDRFLLAILIFQIVFMGPVAEELFFRGFMYNLLKERLGYGVAIVITSFVFSLLHNNIWGFLPIFILSVGICYTYEKTANIISPIIFHSLHNTSSLLSLLIFRSFLQ